MESVYRPDKRNFASELFKPSTVLKSYCDILKSDDEIFSHKSFEPGKLEDAARSEIKNLADFFEVDEDKIAASFSSTMPWVLGIPEPDPTDIVMIEEPLTDKPSSILIQSDQTPRNPYWKNKEIDFKKLRTRSNSLIIREPSEKPGLYAYQGLDDQKAPEKPVIIYTVRVFAPALDMGKGKNAKILDDFLEFMFLGHQKLTELQDVIPCINKNARFGEFSRHQFLIENAPLVKDAYPSGLIHIGKTLYDDTRAHGSRYSKGLVEWGKTKSINFETARMEDTTFDDLELRLGFPYVYQHFSNCEHLLLFVGVRLMHVNDVLDQSLYPLLTRAAPCRELRCYACDLPRSRWLVKSSNRIPVPSAFFCDECLQRFFYKKNEPLGEFQLYSAEPDLRFTDLLDFGKLTQTDKEEPVLQGLTES